MARSPSARSPLLALVMAPIIAGTAAGQVPGWSPVAAGGPIQRHSHVMAYDSGRGVIVLFGGLDGDRTNGVLLGDTWEWDGSSWIQVATTGPSARLGAAMVHDTRRGTALLFGGSDGLYRNDTWEWDGVRWTQVASGGPGVRGRHAMAYDDTRGVAVLFGGNPRGGDETWEWDGSQWRQMAAAGPVARSRAAMTYDRARQRMVMFGGLDSSNRPLGDTWEWDGSTWTQVALSGTVPPPRSRLAMVWDDAHRVSRLFSGNAGPNLRDTWEWDGVAWRQVATGGPPPRMYHAMAHHQARGATLLFGGFDLTNALGDTWEYAASPPCTMPSAFGCATPHCDGAPRLTAASCPRLGNAAFAIEVTNAAPGAPPPAAAWMLISTVPSPGQALPCTGAPPRSLCVNVVPIGLDFAVAIDARGRGALPLPIPDRNELAGLRLLGQLASFHPGRDCPCLLAPGLGLTSSKGLELLIQ